MKKQFGIAIKLFIFMTVLTGFIYPVIVAGIGFALMPDQVQGQLIKKAGVTRGSKLIGQNFENPRYFWSRPSAIQYNPLPSGGSNLSPASVALKKLYDERVQKLQAAHPGQKGHPPQDLLFASGSGLDPDISVEAAEYQAQRVAQVRSLDIAEVLRMIQDVKYNRQWGFLGQPRVNVLELNLMLDSR